jgi:hypothetical protein
MSSFGSFLQLRLPRAFVFLFVPSLKCPGNLLLPPSFVVTNCALCFSGYAIRTLCNTESAVAIFVGTTVQEYDGTSFFMNSFAFTFSMPSISFSSTDHAFMFLFPNNRGLAGGSPIHGTLMKISSTSMYFKQGSIIIILFKFHKPFVLYRKKQTICSLPSDIYCL